MRKTRIVLADDHTILRHGLRAIIEREPDLTVVGEAEDGRMALDLVEDLLPDVIVVDIGMPLLNGLEVTRRIKAGFPQVKVLVLTMHDNEEYVRAMLESGASGFLLKDAAGATLIDAIRAIQRGEAVLSPAVTRLVIEDYLRWGEIRPNSEPGGLTAREREVLQLIAEGYSNRQMAEILCISIKTIQTHVANLIAKLGLHRRNELIQYAIQKKVIGTK